MGSLHWLLHFVECVTPTTSLEHSVSPLDLVGFADIAPGINERGRGMGGGKNPKHMEHFIDVIIIL